MYIYKSYIDNYIKCPHYFALSLLNKSGSEVNDDAVALILRKATKSKSYKIVNKTSMKKDIEWFKDSVSKIAIAEMTSGEKASQFEYRVQYTNKYYKNILNTHQDIDSAALISRLNDAFSIFYNSAFIGYNIPVEIPILKTNITYRDIIDFMLCDLNDPDKITVVEIDNLSDPIQVRKYTEWPHYKLPYYFLAESLGTNINVIIMDPINTDTRIELLYKPRKFDDVHEACSRIVNDVVNPVLFKNLNSCGDCEYSELCFSGEENVGQ